jgi:ATP-dependent Lon protease
LSSDISTRDRDGINKTFSGLVKILFPDGEASREEIEELLRFATEGRKRVKDQLQRIDSTYGRVTFSYTTAAGEEKRVTTLEEEEYSYCYYKSGGVGEDEPSQSGLSLAGESTRPPGLQEVSNFVPLEQHLTFQENQKGVTYDALFGAYLRGVTKLTLTDPYIRLFYQVRNLMEFIETIVKHKTPDEEVALHLITLEDEFKGEQQKAQFEKIRDSGNTVGIHFTWQFAEARTIHARHIVTDNGWKISLDRGLDIFQHYEMNDAFAFSNRLQQFRPCKAFEVTFMKNSDCQVLPS